MMIGKNMILWRGMMLNMILKVKSMIIWWWLSTAQDGLKWQFHGKIMIIGITYNQHVDGHIYFAGM